MFMYTGDYADRFFYTNDNNQHALVGTVDIWRALQPYVTTNRSFSVCPADWTGGSNIPWLNSIGEPTNVLASSYYYIPGFYNSDPPQSLPQVRRTAEVSHPSQKVMIICDAVSGPQDLVTFLNASFSFGQGHGPGSFDVLFVDAHAAYLNQSKWLRDPNLLSDAAKDWASLSWTDFP
jgi:hypothetical protein